MRATAAKVRRRDRRISTGIAFEHLCIYNYAPKREALQPAADSFNECKTLRQEHLVVAFILHAFCFLPYEVSGAPDGLGGRRRGHDPIAAGCRAQTGPFPDRLT